MTVKIRPLMPADGEEGLYTSILTLCRRLIFERLDPLGYTIGGHSLIVSYFKMHPRKENIIDFLTQHARRSPQTAAFCILHNAGEPEQEITYPELASRVEALAHRLIEMQLEGEKVLLVYQDIMKFIVAFLACQFAGIVADPAPFSKGTEQNSRLFGIISHAPCPSPFFSGCSLR